MLDEDVLTYIARALPAQPARVLEIGAGRGELAAALHARGWDVVAIDPSGQDEVVAVSLGEFDAPAGSFDAAVAVVALHHAEPLDASYRRLAELLRPGAVIVVDEFEIATFDARAAAWWLDRRRELGNPQDADPETLRDRLDGLHPVAQIREGLIKHGFELGPVTPGPYLYRWELGAHVREVEISAIASGDLPAVGARFSGLRR